MEIPMAARLDELIAENEALKRDVEAQKEAMASLRREQGHLRLIADHAADIIWTMSLDLKITFGSPSFERILGYRPEDVLNLRLESFLTPSSLEKAMGVIAEELTKEQQNGPDPNRSRTLEMEIFRKDGTLVWVEAQAAFIRGSDGTPLGIFGISRDITERKRTEERLRRLNRMLTMLGDCNQAIVRATEEAALLREICHIIVSRGGYAIALIGYPLHDEAKTLNLVAWSGVEEKEIASVPGTWGKGENGCGPAATAIRTGKPCPIKDLLGCPDLVLGREKMMAAGLRSAIGLPLLAGNETLGAVSIFSRELEVFDEEEVRLLNEIAGDLSFGIAALRMRHARERAEATLRESEEKFRRLVENLGKEYFFYQHDVRGVFTYLSPSITAMLGYSREEVLTHYSEYLTDNPINQEVEHHTNLSIQGVPQPPYEVEIFHKDKRRRWLEVTEIPIRGSDGKVAAIDGIARDITERRRAEEALANSERRFRSLIENAPDIISLVAADGTLLYQSPSLHVVTGWKPEEWVGRSGFEFIHPEDQQTLAPVLADLAQRPGETLAGIRYRVRCKDGGYRILEGVARNLLEDAAVQGIVVNARDITERVQAEEALRINETQLSNALKMARAGHWEYDVGSDTFTFNDNFYRIFRTTADKVGGFRMSSADYARKFCHPDDMALVGKEVEAAIQATDPDFSRQLEHRIIYADGEVGHIAVRFFIIKDKEGRTVRTFGVNQDITERKLADQALRDSEARYRSFAQTFPGIAFRVGKDMTTIFVHGSVKEITGYSEGDVAADRPTLFETLAPEDQRAILEEDLPLVMDTGGTFERDARLVRKDGRIRWVHFMVRVLLDTSDKFLYAQGTLYDITKRKLAEAELKNAHDEIHRKSEALLQLNRELENARHLQRAMLDNIPDMAWMKDSKSRYIAANEALGLMCAVSPDKIAGKTDLDLWPPDLAQKYRSDDLDVVHSRARKRIEEPIEDSKGNRTWIETVKTPVMDENHKVIGTVGIARDVTERKTKEDMIKRHVEMLSALNALLGLMTTDMPLEKMLEKALDTLLEVSFLALESKGVFFLAEDNPPRLVMKAQKRLSPVLLEKCATVRYGQCLCGRVAQTNAIVFSSSLDDRHEVTYDGIANHGHYCVPIKSGESQLLGVLTLYIQEGHEYQTWEENFLLSVGRVLAGMIERKTKDEAIAQARDFYLTLFDDFPALIWRSRRDLKCDYCNRTWLNFTGRSLAEELGDGWLQNVHEEERETYVSTFQEAFCSRKPVEAEFRLRRYDGEYRTLLAIGRPYANLDGTFGGYLTSCFDVSERKHLERELLHAQKMDSIGRLASGIAHEINTPVQFVSDSIYFLKDSCKSTADLMAKYETLKDSAARSGYETDLVEEIDRTIEDTDIPYVKEQVPLAFDRALEGVSRVTDIVRAMREFAHPDRKNKVEADLIKAIHNTLVVARNEYKYVADAETDLEELPPVECHIGDINQVLLNLIVNAAHAIADGVGNSGKKGLIRIIAKRDGDDVVIAIKDSGCGIPQEIRGKIFEPFFTTKELGRGTGQGLAIAYSIVVEKHGGALTFESEVGKGTTFYIRLPILSSPP
ncbi:MAG: PAS domain S-box protein [Myxococcales bacterium]|nr:MAG: PAS domain S-box protein [Myxococcales bacterium]